MNNPCDTCPGVGVCEVDCPKKVTYEGSGMIELRELSYENGKQDTIAEQREAMEAARDEPVPVPEIEVVEKFTRDPALDAIGTLKSRIEAAKNCLVCVDMSSVTADTRDIILRAHSALEGNETETAQEIEIVEKFTRKPTVMVMSIRDNKILHLTTVLAAVKTILLGNWNEEDPKKLISKALAVLYTEAGIETFKEIFAKFDAWYRDKYRHHPEKMVVEQFYKFLNREAV